MSPDAIGRKALTLALATLFSVAAHAAPDWRAPRVVTWECAGCHGIDGNSQWPVMPRLAAQNATYLAQQLDAFRAAPKVASIEIPEWIAPAGKPAATARTGTDARVFMIGPAHRLPPEDAQAAAAWYAKQAPLPGAPGDPALVARGRDVFTKGDPKAGVIACQDCHGPDGKGLATFPRLAGQHAGYLVRQLQAFVSGARPLGSPMHNIAKDLPAEDATAVAAYLQGL
ncbi:MAG: c-type cytochrome [Burkholderiales bacterium]